MKWLPRGRAGRWRLGVLLAMLLFPLLAYTAWSPGDDVPDGRHDRGRNGIWLGHAWLGDDAWFKENNRESQLITHRGRPAIETLATRLRAHRITDLFPHVAPATLRGELPHVDEVQMEQFLDVFSREPERVLPWVGGVRDTHVFPQSQAWREAFIASLLHLLERHPRLAGIHLNAEPWPSGDPHMLVLLDELREALPPAKLLSIAAYPPPTWWHPHPEVHWDESYFRAVASRSDHLAVMMYDTGIVLQKPYRHLMSEWTREVLRWSVHDERSTPVLLGLPAYEDADVMYHNPRVENLWNGLLGIHAGLHTMAGPPPHYQGIAIYAEWTTDESEWRMLREGFLGVAERE